MFKRSASPRSSTTLSTASVNTGNRNVISSWHSKKDVRHVGGQSTEAQSELLKGVIDLNQCQSRIDPSKKFDLSG
jgi:hypothetical protein